MELRKYQENAIENLRNVLLAGNRKPVMVLPTGGGKSIIFGQLIRNVVDKGNKVLWLVHRRNLVLQMKDVLNSFDIEPGLIMSGYESSLDNQVQLGTIQTYARRLKLRDLDLNNFFIDADILLVDEAHRSLSKQYREIVDLYLSKIIIGCTATPMGASGRGMGEVYNAIVDIVDVEQLTKEGYLSPARYFAPYTPDLSGVSVKMGDYVVKELEEKTNKAKLNGDIVENWLKLGENRKTIVFAVNVRHSIAVCEAFNNQGIPAEHLEARSTDEEREEVFKRMEKGKTTVICNVGLYQEGLDVPDVSCIIMARPTKSLGLYRQCCGRGLRISKEHEDCLILDHGGVIEQNGFLDEKITWTLDGKTVAYQKPKEAKEKAKAECTVCGLIFEKVSKCPDCGSPIKTFGKKITTTDDKLKEIKGKKKASMAEKRAWYGMFLHYAEKKGYKEGWIAHKYKAKFKVWPNSLKNTAPIEPTQEFNNYIRHLNIKYAKNKRKPNTMQNTPFSYNNVKDTREVANG